MAFRSGEAVYEHPDLKILIDDGWLVESAIPLVRNPDDVKLRVVLRSASSPMPLGL